MQNDNFLPIRQFLLRTPSDMHPTLFLFRAGESGMGGYHGKDGFDAFSHYKSIVDKKTRVDLPMRYQPYQSKLYEALLHLFLR